MVIRKLFFTFLLVALILILLASYYLQLSASIFVKIDDKRSMLMDKDGEQEGITKSTPGKSAIGISNTTTVDKYRPKILVWAQPYPKVTWTLPDLPGDSGGCDLMWNRADYPESDAVIFFMKNCKKNDLPAFKLRKPHQAFVWWAHESPWTVRHIYKHGLTDFNNYFNWTMTYKSDSDIIAALAPIPMLDYLLYRLHREDEMEDKDLINHPVMSETQFKSELNLLMTHKSHFAAWVVSDCAFTAGAKKRMNIIKELKTQGGLNITEYGKCAKNPIPQNFTVLFQTLSPNKFYFAFENSYHCKDYFTEKIYYNGFVAGAVPIVYGPNKSDLEKVVPPGSFIFYEDFKDITDFAKYLKYLDSNDEAYGKYFEWWKSPGSQVIPRYGFNFGSNPEKITEGPSDRKRWTYAIQDNIRDYQRLGFHHLCRKLRAKEHISTSKTIPDLSKWWYGPESSECV